MPTCDNGVARVRQKITISLLTDVSQNLISVEACTGKMCVRGRETERESVCVGACQSVRGERGRDVKASGPYFAAAKAALVAIFDFFYPPVYLEKNMFSKKSSLE